jgi:2-polyprenyl-6-hydroxyphenyl methylase/3-demethylubiquinone-9 3-methyltransferase
MSRRNDLQIYEQHGDSWWDAGVREFASLQSISRFRLGVLRSWLGAELPAGRVVDLGCGGGLMSVPLGAMGALVVGVDLSPRSLRCAAAQAEERCSFVHGDISATPLRDGCADLVLLCDVLEHVDDMPGALAESARLLAPGGAVFVSTIDRSRWARFLAVTVAEGLRLIPPGTHDPAMFRRPAEVDAAARVAGLHRAAIQGERVAIWSTLRHWAIRLVAGDSIKVSYSVLYRKGAAA